MQEATNLLEKRLKLIASLCEERKELNKKEREVTLSKCFFLMTVELISF